jgi:DNA replication and repair protein RecF
MLLKHLSLTNFRNFIRLERDFSPGSTILAGSNGQGKTSLLEAIYFLTSATTYHAANDRQLINFLALEDDAPFARLVAELEASGRLRRIEIRIILNPTGKNGNTRIKKEVLVNGLSRRIRELAGVCNAVMFLPQDMDIIEGSPGSRRKYIDSSLNQADPTYTATLSEYNKVLTQRNALLKQIQERKAAEDQLPFWDNQLSTLAAALIRMRSLALTELNDLAKPIHGKLTRGHENLQINYVPSYDPAARQDGQLGLPIDTPLERNNISTEDIKQGMSEKFLMLRSEEIARGVTLVGPHRDDFTFRANGVDLRTYGSRGQNRTAILATKLSEILWLRNRTQEWPILLLDEVLAELDSERREALLGSIETVEQAILTGADASMFSSAFKEEATIWQISAGTITP